MAVSSGGLLLEWEPWWPTFRTSTRAQQPALRQHRLDRRLRIAREQRREAAAPQQPHHRRVVDVAIRQRAGHVGGRRIQDGQHGGCAESDALTRARRRRVDRRARREPAPGSGGRSGSGSRAPHPGSGRPDNAPGQPPARRRGPRAGGSGSPRRSGAATTAAARRGGAAAGRDPGPPSISSVSPEGAVTRIASPWPISSATRCRRPSGRVASVRTTSSAPTAASPTIGRARARATLAEPLHQCRPMWRRTQRQQLGARFCLAPGGSARPANRRQPSASAGYQASASQPGAVTGSAANGTDAAACPATIMAAQHEPRGPADGPASRVGQRVQVQARRDRPQWSRDRAQEHHDRHQRDHHHVRRRRHQREALEAPDHDRQRGQLRGQGQRHRLAQPARPAGEPRLDRRCEEDQAARSPAQTAESRRPTAPPGPRAA